MPSWRPTRRGVVAQGTWNNADAAAATVPNLVDATGAKVAGMSVTYTFNENVGGPANAGMKVYQFRR